jgi:3-deoxy-D-manno-octulosonic-acid transferase
MTLRLYRLITGAIRPALKLYLHRRAMRGKEDPDRLGERLGRTGLPRPHGPLVWVHASSVGESLSVLPLIERIEGAHAARHVLVTTATVTSARLMDERLPGAALHQYAPADTPAAVRRFLDHWQPNLALWVESELWPNMIVDTAARRTPMVLVNGRVSEPSAARWHRFPRTARRVLGAFSLCLAQDEVQAARFTALGAPNVKCVGNLKWAAAALPANAAALAALVKASAGRPLWLAASTHPGEEERVAAAHARVRAAYPQLLTVIVPRHPERGPEIVRALRAGGLAVAARSTGEALSVETDIYLADTLGELGLFCRLAGTVLLGGSLTPRGGHNPLEPARLGCALLFGPHMDNFATIAGTLCAAGAAEVVSDEDALCRALTALLSDENERARRAAAAGRIATANAGILDDVFAEIAPYLPAAKGLAVARA